MCEFKISFVGDTGVGKTSIITRYSHNKFLLDSPPTVGASNFHFSVSVGDTEIVLNVWDTAGQERFRSLVPLYTRDAKIIVIVFDIGEMQTFDSLDEWYSKLKIDLGLSCEFFLVANKIDLEQVVPVMEVKNWAHSKGITHIHFTSAAENRGIDELFLTMAETLSELVKKQQETQEQPSQDQNLELQQNNETPEKKKRCC